MYGVYLLTRLSQRDRDNLEVAGMTPCAIDDAIAQLVARGVQSFTAQDVIMETLPGDDKIFLRR